MPVFCSDSPFIRNFAILLTVSKAHIFPLPLVAFENELVNLHIFEPRYIHLIQKCEMEKCVFLIPTVLDGEVSKEAAEVELNKIINRYPGGDCDIKCKVLSRVVILDVFPSFHDAIAGEAEYERLDLIDNDDKELSFRIRDLLAELYHLTDNAVKFVDQEEVEMTQYVHKCGMGIKEEYELASLRNTQDRQLYLIQHLKLLISTVSNLKNMNRLIQLNGHFKKLPQSF